MDLVLKKFAACTGCAFEDNKGKEDRCRQCERNPSLVHLKDMYIRKDKHEQQQSAKVKDVVADIEEQTGDGRNKRNDSFLSDWGVR